MKCAGDVPLWNLIKLGLGEDYHSLWQGWSTQIKFNERGMRLEIKMIDDDQ